MLPITLTGGSRPAPYYGMFAGTMGLFLGRWIYRIICNALLPKSESEKVIDSQILIIHNSSNNGQDDEICYESDDLKL